MTAGQRRAAAIALSVACVVCSGCRRAEPTTPPPVASPAPAAPAVDGHIDPTPYRAEIEAAEALLYANDAPGDDDWKNLSRALLELHNAIVFRDTSPEARETSRKLFFFSADVDSRKAPKEAGEQLAAVRATWEDIRSKQFIQADWFHGATP
jgi:hypothetical protein